MSLILNVRIFATVLIVFELLVAGIVIAFSWTHGYVNATRSALETTIVSFITTINIFVVVLLLQKVNQLENIVKVCAWTKKIQIDGEWLSIEEFLGKYLGVQVTHGITQEAAEQLLQNIKPPKKISPEPEEKS